jgi:hypothetical protein
MGRRCRAKRYTLPGCAGQATHPRPCATQANAEESGDVEVILGSGSTVYSFHADNLSVFLIKCTVHQRNPHRHPLPPPYNYHQHPLLLRLPAYLNSHSRSRKLFCPQNRNFLHRLLGKNPRPYRTRHGRKSPRNSWYKRTRKPYPHWSPNKR